MALQPPPLRLAMVAGEPSRDLLAAALLDGLSSPLPAFTQVYGIGGPRLIATGVDHMLCVFPFETALLEKSGVAASYVGHPLADEIPLVPDVAGARRTLGLPESGPVIAVLPGSRRSEIGLIGPTFFDAMELMQQREPGVRFVMPAATPALRELLQPLVDAHSPLALTITDGQSQTAMTAADAILVKSGTVTLEAAL